ncbi:hypothetical protein PV341_26755 [Streptomyces sp. PA03-1a]|nr:hypothetical protein [Streptomyces sp. PA03-1a]MDX2811981.1 hypothetical protein [Streptomyces sp. PA03-5A]
MKLGRALANGYAEETDEELPGRERLADEEKAPAGRAPDAAAEPAEAAAR